MRRHAPLILAILALIAMFSWGLYWRELAYAKGNHVFVHCVEL